MHQYELYKSWLLVHQKASNKTKNQINGSFSALVRYGFLLTELQRLPIVTKESNNFINNLLRLKQWQTA